MSLGRSAGWSGYGSYSRSCNISFIRQRAAETECYLGSALPVPFKHSLASETISRSTHCHRTALQDLRSAFDSPHQLHEHNSQTVNCILVLLVPTDTVRSFGCCVDGCMVLCFSDSSVTIHNVIEVESQS